MFGKKHGGWRWRAETNYPVQNGLTPTAGGVVFFGGMSGSFYALEASDGHELGGSAEERRRRASGRIAIRNGRRLTATGAPSI